ncbi:predicted protein [Streptomyces sp. AA4]|nr:predicted protein [Streptomyces sp. AA4]
MGQTWDAPTIHESVPMSSENLPKTVAHSVHERPSASSFKGSAANSLACEASKGSALSSCIESLAEGSITAEDLCPPCTRSFMAALDGITGPLAWSRGYRQRARGVCGDAGSAA